MMTTTVSALRRRLRHPKSIGASQRLRSQLPPLNVLASTSTHRRSHPTAVSFGASSGAASRFSSTPSPAPPSPLDTAAAVPSSPCEACPSNPKKNDGEASPQRVRDMGQPGTHKEVPFLKILSLLQPEKTMIAVALGGISLSAGATMAFPAAIGQIIDILTLPVTPEGVNQIQQISLTMVGIFSAGAVATFVHSSVLEVVGQRVGARLRKKMFSRIMDQEMGFFDQNRVGELANRLSTDVHEVAEHLVENVATFLENTVKAASAVIAMVWISMSLTATAGLMVPAVVAGAFFYGRFIKKLSRKHLDALAAATQIAAERFAAVRTVASFGQIDREVTRYSTVINNSYTLAKKVALFQGGFMATSYLAGNGALLGVLWLGGTMVMDNALTAGTLASFCMYAGHLAVAITDVTESISGFLRAQGSGSRLFMLMERDTAVNRGKVRPHDAFARGTIKFENISFSYPASPDQQILRDLSIEIVPGEVVAITGRSGCGKSSMVALLERLYDPTSGRITLSDIDIVDFDINWLRSQIGTVQQEPILFALSIRENIAYGKPDATEEEIFEAAKAAHIHDFIMSLPDGYDTHVGERGLSLSGGQKQRLAVARALVLKPAIVVFDEATSALDKESEKRVHDTLRALVDGGGAGENKRTCIVIAHHLSTLAVADRVIVVDDGQVVQEGKFEDLMQVEGGTLQNLMAAGTLHAPHPSAITNPHGAHPLKARKVEVVEE